MIPLVAVSGEECIAALKQGGFVVCRQNAETTTMRRGDREVIVPDVDFLAPDDLRALLRDAGVAYTDFLDLLSETPTDPVAFAGDLAHPLVVV